MRQAIVTKWHGPTNYSGSRIKAKAAAGSITVPWDYALNVADNHTAAARALVEKLEWAGVWSGGGMPSGDGYVFVDASGAEPFTGTPAPRA